MFNPYQEVIKVVREWCDVYDSGSYEDFLVELKLDGGYRTEILICDIADSDDYFVFLHDWYEGEQDIEIVGFRPVSTIHMEGIPNKDRRWRCKMNKELLGEVPVTYEIY